MSGSVTLTKTGTSDFHETNTYTQRYNTADPTYVDASEDQGYVTVGVHIPCTRKQNSSYHGETTWDDAVIIINLEGIISGN